MSEHVEECKNDWWDGTCPQCGETHYVIVRRSVLAQAEREREAMRDELANLRVLHEANCHYKTERDNTRAEVERLKGHGQLTKPGNIWHDRAMNAEAALARVRAALDTADEEAAKNTNSAFYDGARYLARKMRAALEGRG